MPMRLLKICDSSIVKPLSVVVACICSPATLEAKFRNGVCWIPVGGNSPSIDG